MKKLQYLYMAFQVIFAFILMLFAGGNIIRCLITGTGIIYCILFGLMAFVAYKLMFIPSIRELRDFLIDK